MAILADYHTHTTYSRHHHGKGTVLDNVRAAYEKGLRQIAITDHGFNQKMYGLRRTDLEKVKKDIEEAQEQYPVEVLLGVEANIISSKGDLDITAEEHKNFDVLAFGFHRLVRSVSKKEQWGFVLKNWFCSIFHHTSKKQREINTQAYIQAMQKYDVDIITHLNFICKVNVAEIAQVAKETNTLIELNGKRLGMSDEEILTCYKAGCKFVLGSDAHSPARVGDCHLGLQAILRLKLPDSCIVNYNNIPKFKNTKGV